MALNIAHAVRQEFPAVVGNPGRDYIFADAPTGTQVKSYTNMISSFTGVFFIKN